MFAIIRVPISPQFLAPQNAVFIKSFSSRKSSSDVNGNYAEQFSTISYLINTCGLSSKDSISVSKKITIKSPEKTDSVLKLLREYGFTDANMPKLITRYPRVLLSSPEKTLLPKLEFFRSIGVPLDVLAKNISFFPLILQRSLDNYIIPLYDYLRDLFQSDKRVVTVFIRAPRAFAHGWPRKIQANVAILRERGIPESSIVALMAQQPLYLVLNAENLASCIDRAAEMEFDKSKFVFIHAIQVFVSMSESTLNHKMEVYRRCGWSESDIRFAFLRYPMCLNLSEKKIMANMDFLVNDCGIKPASVARRPALLGFNLEKRMKPRFLVARVLKEKGLFGKRIDLLTLMNMSEEKFLERYVVKHQEDVPQLLDIYRGKVRVPPRGFTQEMIFK